MNKTHRRKAIGGYFQPVSRQLKLSAQRGKLPLLFYDTENIFYDIADYAIEKTVQPSLHCHGICPFIVAFGERQIPSWLNECFLTDFAAGAKSWGELLRS